MNRLKELRERTGLRLRDLERYVGIRNATLSQIENGKQQFREIHVLKLTSFFDVTSDYLLGYSDSGIGVYFDDEHTFVSEMEMHVIKSQHEVSEALIAKHREFGLTVYAEGKKTSTYSCRHCIYRSVGIPQADAGITSSVKERIISELNRLDARELDKVLRFIQEYIK